MLLSVVLLGRGLRKKLSSGRGGGGAGGEPSAERALVSELY
jgi:hypothetical protein